MKTYRNVPKQQKPQEFSLFEHRQCSLISVRLVTRGRRWRFPPISVFFSFPKILQASRFQVPGASHHECCTGEYAFVSG